MASRIPILVNNLIPASHLPNDRVRVDTDQTLTLAQRAQARENIDAISTADLAAATPRVVLLEAGATTPPAGTVHGTIVYRKIA